MSADIRYSKQDADEPRGCDDLTTALLCFITGAVMFVAVLAVAGALP